jgi:pimeloyl-ACP methyl ester carboxylesterase
MMSTANAVKEPVGRATADTARGRLLDGLPVTQRTVEAAGISTPLLEGGDGPAMVLLHGPGEFSAKWLRVIPDLATRHRVIAPDLPGHGASEISGGSLDADRALAWLGELIDRVCSSPPVLLGHVLGGALAARYAIHHGDRVGRLVLVDTLGLAPFRPSPRFALTMMHFLARPTERTYTRFMNQCSYDLDGLRRDLGDRWSPFVSYNLDRIRTPSVREAVRILMREVGLPAIPPDDLARIAVPVTLIWGRHDRANRLRIAEAASARYGWPLHVIEECADDPPRDQPQAFLRALRSSLATDSGKEARS